MTASDQQISATRREVQTRAVDGTQAQVVRVTRAYETSVEDLWTACTNAERIPRWLLPISGELRLGGHYQLEGNAGGTITRCDPPRLLAASWEYGGSVRRLGRPAELLRRADGGVRSPARQLRLAGAARGEIIELRVLVPAGGGRDSTEGGRA
jgi:uncharacterized protein YndB with AHSA1/START domain